MTEADALTKWCPFAIEVQTETIPAVAVSVAGFNRPVGSATDSLCVASGCMAWISYSGTKVPAGRCGLVNVTAGENS